jgi:hypothetical protein
MGKDRFLKTLLFLLQLLEPLLFCLDSSLGLFGSSLFLASAKR